MGGAAFADQCNEIAMRHESGQAPDKSDCHQNEKKPADDLDGGAGRFLELDEIEHGPLRYK